jgi:hypothetical protein
MASTLEKSFQDCMTNQSSQYLQSVTNLLKQSDSMQFLSKLAFSKLEAIGVQRQAQILLARIEQPDVFTDFSKTIEDLRKKPDVIACRNAYFSSSLLKFTKAGIESEYVTEKGERHLTPNGWEDSERKVKKYTEEDVNKGKARNFAAQLSLLEYYLKFSAPLNDYEMIEMLICLQKIEKGNISKNSQKTVATKDLIKAVVEDVVRPITVRIKAVSLLPTSELNMPFVTELMFSALQDTALENEKLKLNYSAVHTACEFFKQFGSDKELKRLKELGLKSGWRHDLVAEAVKEVETRTKQGGDSI